MPRRPAGGTGWLGFRTVRGQGRPAASGAAGWCDGGKRRDCEDTRGDRRLGTGAQSLEELRAKFRAINAQTPGKTEEYQRPESKTNQQDREPDEICKTSTSSIR